MIPDTQLNSLVFAGNLPSFRSGFLSSLAFRRSGQPVFTRSFTGSRFSGDGGGFQSWTSSEAALKLRRARKICAERGVPFLEGSADVQGFATAKKIG